MRELSHRVMADGTFAMGLRLTFLWERDFAWSIRKRKDIEAGGV
jgi:hypothetical protein